jgi:UDP-N-acetylglucosamine 2-epimerase (non-hydrolysing)
MQGSEASVIKILTVVGARPNFMKAAPIIAAINEYNRRLLAGNADRPEPLVETIRHILVHTGQHYDELMSGSFFSDLNLPKPDIHLGVGSGSHAVQTAEIMKKFEEVLLGEKPEVVVVVGDVNSTLACALVTSKISFDADGSRPVIAHVEAGLRSFDRSMPEEVNRILTDQVSDLLFVTEESGLQNLRNEGVSLDRIHLVGNTMIDSLLNFKEKAETSTILEKLALVNQAGKNGEADSVTRYALLTLHRPSNVDNRAVFLNIIAGLEELATDCPVIFPVHPRTQRRIREFEIGLEGSGRKHKGNGPASGVRRDGIILTDPLGYLDFLCLMKHASLVVTDSGGIQEETTILGTPCVTVRENTERPVTVQSGTNTIAGTKTDAIKDAIRRQLGRKSENDVPKNWDGRAGARIIDILVRWHYAKTPSRPSFNPLAVPLEDRYLRPQPN